MKMRVKMNEQKHEKNKNTVKNTTHTITYEKRDRKNTIIAWCSWILAVAFVVLVFSYQTGYAIIKHEVANANNLSSTQIGLVGATYTWSFAIFQLISGSLLDRAGIRRVLPIAMTLLSIGIFSFATISSFQLLIISQMLIALGACCGFVGAGTTGGVWFGMAKFGILFAFVEFIASVSATINQNILTYVIDVWGWHNLLYSMAFVGIILAILSVIILRDPPEISATRKWPHHPIEFLSHVQSDIKTTLSKPKLWVILLLSAASFAGMLSVGTVWGTDIAMMHDLDKNVASLVLPWGWLGLALGSPIFAFLSNMARNRRLFLIGSVSFQAIIILYTIIGTFSSAITVGILYFLFGFCAGGSMLGFTMAGELAGVKLAGTSSSLVNGTQFVGAGFFIFLPGYLQSYFAEQSIIPFLSIPIILFISLGFSVLLPETYKK